MTIILAKACVDLTPLSGSVNSADAADWGSALLPAVAFNMASLALASGPPERLISA